MALLPVAVSVSRRRLVAAAGAWLLAPQGDARAAPLPPTGWVSPPQPAPPLGLLGTDGQERGWPVVLAGKVTAVQLIFTGCSATCPTQGALFAAMAQRLRSNDVQLLSISIDALGDDPRTLAAWQGRFGAHAAWLAAVPRPRDVDRIADFLKGAQGVPGTHTAQVFVFDRRAQLRYRTGDWPAAETLAALIDHVARNG